MNILLILPVPRLFPWDVFFSGSYSTLARTFVIFFLHCSLWRLFGFDLAQSRGAASSFAVVRSGARTRRGVIAAFFALCLGSRARPLAGRPSQIIAQDAFSIVPRRRGKDSFTQSKRFLFDEASVFVVTGARSRPVRRRLQRPKTSEQSQSVAATTSTRRLVVKGLR